MWKLFEIDGPIVTGINKLVSLVWLNILTLLCCVPIITIGASMTAMHYVVLHISQDDEPAIAKTFFKAFKDNFRKSTLGWMIYLLLLGSLAGGCWMIFINGWNLHSFFWTFFAIVGIVVLLLANWTFILQSRYDNNLRNTIKNAIVVGLLYLHYTLIFAVTMAIPVFLLLYMPKILPVTLGFWFTAPAYAQAKLYGKVFHHLEEMEQKKPEPKEPTDENDCDEEE